MIEKLDFWVPGRPRTKGSLKPARTGSGAVRLVDTVHSKEWRSAVCKAVIPLIADEDVSIPEGKKGRWRLRHGWPSLDPILVRATFYYQRSANDTDARPINRQYGDLDKLMRNVLDALQDSGVYRDDSQVVAMPLVSKFFCDVTSRIFRNEGAVIVVSGVPGQ